MIRASWLATRDFQPLFIFAADFSVLAGVARTGLRFLLSIRVVRHPVSAVGGAVGSSCGALGFVAGNAVAGGDRTGPVAIGDMAIDEAATGDNKVGGVGRIGIAATAVIITAGFSAGCVCAIGCGG